MDSLGDEADKVGTSVEALSRLKFAAQLLGSDPEAVGNALGKLNKNLHEAATAGGPAAGVLKKIGLDAKQLSAEDPAQAFQEISAGIASLPNQADKAAAAMALFGKGGTELLNALSADQAQVQALMKEADELGVTVSNLDRIKVGSMFDAFDKVSAALTGIGNKIAAEVAPYITELINLSLDWFKSVNKGGALITAAFGYIVEAIAFVGDAIDTVVFVFKMFQAVASEVLRDVLQGVANLAKGIESFINMIPGMNVSFSSTLSAMAEAAGEVADNQFKDLNKTFEGPSTGDKFRSFLEGIKKGADDSAVAIDGMAKSTRGFSESFADIGEFEKFLREQIATWGMSTEAVKLHNLAAHGATEDQLADAKGLVRQLNKMHALEDAASPMEKARLGIDKLRKELKEGVIDEETFNLGLSKIGKDMGDPGTNRRSAAMEAGSKEARSTLLDYAHSQIEKDPEKERTRLAQAALNAELEGNKNTSALVSAFRNLQVITIS